VVTAISLLICLAASALGAICGIGGGVIIKPVLDSLGIYSVSTVNFLSGCTVLSMSGYTVLKGLRDTDSSVDWGRTSFLAVGAALGGLLGKELFSQISELFAASETVGAIQAVCLFIITLGTQSIFQGLMLVISDSRNIYGFPASFTKTMSASVLYIPVPVIIALIVAAACAFFTTKCKAGRNIYALGGNMEAAWYSGVNVNLHRLLVFMISGTCSGIAGIVLLGRVGAAAPTAGTGYETYAIAATIIGGTSFMGGKGKILGVVIGGMIIGIINYGMTALMIPSSYQKIVMGALIIISVAIDHFVAKAKN